MTRSKSPSRWDLVCEGMIEASWLAVLLLAPLFFAAYSDRPFDPAKSSLVQALVATAMGAWLAKVGTGGRLWLPIARSRKGPANGRLLLLSVILVVVSLALSTVLSLDSSLSWRGSYARSFGTSTQLALMLLFFLTLGHLRRSEQLRRLLSVASLASVPVCLYALLQSLGLDPIIWGPAATRPGSSLGNPIFLGGYLCFSLFLTLAGLKMSATRRSTEATWQGVRQGVLVAVLGLQLWTLMSSGSRGPLLGALAGATFLGLLAWPAFGKAREEAHSSPRFSGRRLRLGLAVATMAVVLGAFLVLTHLQKAMPPQPQPTYFRILNLFDSNSGTARVRRLIWSSAFAAFESDTPLVSPSGPDRLHDWRRWLGFGPETTALAPDQHRSPELSRYEADRVPDRAHNQAIEALMLGGLVGLLAWALLQTATLELGLSALGLVATRMARFGLRFALSGGALVGSILPKTLWHADDLAILGAVAGALAGLAIYLLVIGSRPPCNPRIENPNRATLIVILLAGLIAHLVEGQFGIGVVALRVYYWITLAILVVLSLEGREEVENREEDDEAPPIGISTLTALLAVSLVYLFQVARHDDPVGVWALIDSQGAVWWLIAGSSMVGLALGRALRRWTPWMIVAASVSLSSLYVSRHASLMEYLSGNPHGKAWAQQVAQNEALLATIFFAGLLLVIGWLGWRLASQTKLGIASPVERSPSMGLRLAAAAVCLSLVVVVTYRSSLPNLEIGVLVQMAKFAQARGEPQQGMELLERAQHLDPRDSHLPLQAGRMSFHVTRNASEPAQREAALTLGRMALGRAAELSPFNADHVVNLGRWHVLRAIYVHDEGERRSELRRAAEAYQQALEMRANSVPLRVVLAAIRQDLGETDRAIRLLESALAIDPKNVDALLQLQKLSPPAIH